MRIVQLCVQRSEFLRGMSLTDAVSEQDARN